MSIRWILLIICLVTSISCSVVSGVMTVGKVGWTTAKVTGKVVATTGKVAYKTGKVTSKAARTVVYIAKGKQIIPLEKVGNSLYVTVRLGKKKVPARLLVDTGASATQISISTAKRLGLNLNKAERVPAQLANGQVVYTREVMIPKIQLKSVQVSNVRALVLEQEIADDSDGLLGMSFLDHFIFQIDANKPELILHQKAK